MKERFQTPRILRRALPVAVILSAVSCETADPSDNITPDDDKDDDVTVELPNSRPNIVLMLADDMGFDDMSYRGNQCVETPNLDSLARISTRFENFYVHSVSAPTRASLLTGRHFLRCGVSGMHAGRDFMNLDEVTIAEALGKAGYKTGVWGKWHSGKSNGYYPWQRGFDEAYMASLYHHNYNNGLYKGEYEGKQYNGEVLSFAKSDGVWTDAKMTDMALDFMSRNKDNSFFAFIPYLAPHEGWAAPEEYVEPYLRQGQSKNFATLNGMISHLDLQVGRVIDKIEELGIADNTIIIFMSDNGPNYNKSLLTESEWTLRNPSGYKGSKSKNTENGIHSPLFIYWKGRTVAVDNMSVLGVCDIFPTLCELAGVSIPADCKPLDGKSFRNVIAAPSWSDTSRTLYISHWSPFDKSGECLDEVALTAEVVKCINPELQHIGLRHDNYKLLLNEYGEEDIALWNLSVDYAETKNLYENGSSTDRTKAKEYKAELIKWYQGILNDKGSYTTPSFEVGAPAFKYSEVYCYAPIATTDGVTNESLKLSGFNSAGEGATYSIKVLRAGNYDLRIYLNGSKSVGNEVFTISTNIKEDIGEATFGAGSYSSKWCQVTLESEVTSLTITLKESTVKEFALKNLRLEYLDN